MTQSKSPRKPDSCSKCGPRKVPETPYVRGVKLCFRGVKLFAGVKLCFGFRSARTP